MRRVFAAGALVVAAMAISGCSTNATAAPPAWSSPSAETGDGTAASTPDVCARIRSAISADMTPLGTALGSMVGYGVGKDSDDRQIAQTEVVTKLKAIGTDISQAAANAADPVLRTAATTTAKNIDDLADDPTFLGGITSLSDLTSVTDKLAVATQPVVTTCG